jgi:hypothetical protein
MTPGSRQASTSQIRNVRTGQWDTAGIAQVIFLATFGSEGDQRANSRASIHEPWLDRTQPKNPTLAMMLGGTWAKKPGTC